MARPEDEGPVARPPEESSEDSRQQVGETIVWIGESLDALAGRVRKALARSDRVAVQLGRHYPASITEQAFAAEMAAVGRRVGLDTDPSSVGFVAVFARHPSG